MNKSLFLFAFVCLFGISFTQQTPSDLVNLAINYAPELISNAPDYAIVKNGNDGVEVTTTGSGLTDLVFHLDSVDLSENTEAEWFVEWSNEGQVWDIVDDGNGYFTVNGPSGSQDYYVPVAEWVENVPQESVSGIINDLTGDLVNLVQEAGGELDLTVAEAYTAAALPIANALANAAASAGGSATTTIITNAGGGTTTVTTGSSGGR